MVLATLITARYGPWVEKKTWKFYKIAHRDSRLSYLLLFRRLFFNTPRNTTRVIHVGCECLANGRNNFSCDILPKAWLYYKKLSKESCTDSMAWRGSSRCVTRWSVMTGALSFHFIFFLLEVQHPKKPTQFEWLFSIFRTQCAQNGISDVLANFFTG